MESDIFKGPWKRENRPLGIVITDKNDDAVAYVVDNVLWGYIQRYRNAHLIESAPSLFESLVNMVKWYGERNEYSDKLFEMDSQSRPEIKDAMKAILQAEPAFNFNNL